eukprot:445062-Lingulodinium_polyedra.AAC.1
MTSSTSLRRLLLVSSSPQTSKATRAMSARLRRPRGMVPTNTHAWHLEATRAQMATDPCGAVAE